MRFGVKAPLMNKDRSEPAPMPATEPNRTQQPATSSRADVEAFLGQVAALDPAVKGSERGRLIFALDATMSRQPTWDQACQLQAEMFREAAIVGGLIFNSSITEGSLNAAHRDGSLSQSGSVN